MTPFRPVWHPRSFKKTDRVFFFGQVEVMNKKGSTLDPWDCHIYLHEWLIFMVNVGKYTSPMDPMGLFWA